MIRRVALWHARACLGQPRAQQQLCTLHSAIAGVSGGLVGLAIGLIIARPFLALVGFEGAWR